MRNTLVKTENPERTGTEMDNVARGRVIFTLLFLTNTDVTYWNFE